MKRFIVIVFAFALLLITTLIYYRAYSPNDEAWAASADLMNQKYYGFGHDLGTREPTEVNKLFITIIDSPKSHLVFRKMYDEGGDVAKAYAIAGLHQSVLGRLDNRINDFRMLNISIPVGFHGPISPEDVLSEITSNNFQHNIREL